MKTANTNKDTQMETVPDSVYDRLRETEAETREQCVQIKALAEQTAVYIDLLNTLTRLKNYGIVPVESTGCFLSRVR